VVARDSGFGGLPHWPRYEVPARSTLNKQASGLMTIGGGGKYWRWTESDQ